MICEEELLAIKMASKGELQDLKPKGELQDLKPDLKPDLNPNYMFLKWRRL